MASAYPTFTVVVDGVDVSHNFRSKLISLRTIDGTRDVADRCEITLDDRNGQLAIPRKGAWISIAIGWDGQMVPMGQFAVESIVLEGGGERPWTMTIFGDSANLSGGGNMKPGVM